MGEYNLNAVHIRAFAEYLHEEERAEATIEKYLRDIREFRA